MAGELSNRAFAFFANEVNPIVLGTGGAPDVVGAAPTSFTIIPRVDLPGGNAGLNNRKDYGIGTRGAQSNDRGLVSPSVSLSARLASTNFAGYAFPTSGVDNPLTQFCLIEGLSGVWTKIYRYCKMNTLTFNFTTGQPVTIAAGIMAQASYYLATPKTLTTGDVAALRAVTPYFWHDARTLTLGGTDISRYTESFSLNINNNVTPRLQRGNWGATQPLSRTVGYLAEGTFNVSGNLNWARETPTQFIDATNCADVWGDLVGSFRNSPCSTESATGFDFTVANCLLSNEEIQPVGVGAPINFNLPFEADYMTYQTA